MSQRNQKNSSLLELSQRNVAKSFAMSLCEAMLAPAVGLLLLFRVVALILVLGGARQKEARFPAVSKNLAASPPAPLQWRRPWGGWHLLSWSSATLLAPGFWLITGLLLINAHCDHPVFWWSLPLITFMGNTAALVDINLRHHHRPFVSRAALTGRYALAGSAVGGTLFLLAGWISGFLPDVVAQMSGAMQSAFPVLDTMLWSTVVAIAFSALSFVHGGFLHAWFCFRRAGAG